MPTVTIKDLLDSKDGTVTWGPLRATVKRAPKDVARSTTEHGEWVRATLTVSDGTGEIDVVWSDPSYPYEDNPKAIEGKTIQVEQGAKKDVYKDKARLKVKGGFLVVLDGGEAPQAAPAVTYAPAPTSHAPATVHAPAGALTDRALLQAVAAWAPKIIAALTPGMEQPDQQAVAAMINTMVIAATGGKLTCTMFAETDE